MAVETFTERFRRVTEHLSDTELQSVLGLSYGSVQRLKSGDTLSLKLDGGLRLAKKLGVSPYGLAGEPEPSHHMDVEIDGVRFAIYAPITKGDPEAARVARNALANAMRKAGAEVWLRSDADITLPIASETESRLTEDSARLRALEAEMAEIRALVPQLIAAEQSRRVAPEVLASSPPRRSKRAPAKKAS